MKKVLLEGLLVALAGVMLAFVANALSPRGLKLSRDYFAGSSRNVGSSNVTAAAGQVLPAEAGQGTNSPLQLLTARLEAKGLNLADSNQVIELFHDPRRGQDLVAFIDARDQEHYVGGHIPAAHQFDYYRPENYLANILQVCQFAQKVVVYCNGGDCEDSELAAGLLLQAGIPAQKLLVYGGGITEWSTNRLPVEVGPRGSGQLKQGP